MGSHLTCIEDAKIGNVTKQSKMIVWGLVTTDICSFII